jgi:hypothetical protein
LDINNITEKKIGFNLGNHDIQAGGFHCLFCGFDNGSTATAFNVSPQAY